MFNSPWDFSSAWGQLPEQPPSPPIIPQDQPLLGPGGVPRDPTQAFNFSDPNTGAADPVKALAGHLASKGITPQQFMQNPSVASPQPETPPLGASLSGDIPMPRPAPVPSFGVSGSDATVRNVENGTATAAQPRGLRNNNPLNIEDSPFARSMPGYKGSDGRFAQFDTIDNGKAAASNLLDTYQNKYGLNTVRGIIGRWAPAGDGANNPDAYAATVAKKLGIDPNAPIPPEKRQALIEAMSGVENGTGGTAVASDGTTDASAKSKVDARGNPTGPTSEIGKRLAGALSGVKAPPPPVQPKISTPSVPSAHGTVKGGNIAALLASLMGGGGATPQAGSPVYLSNLLRRG